MQHRSVSQFVREWLPALLGGFCVVVAVLFLLVNQGKARQQIVELRQAGENLIEAAQNIEMAAVTPDESQRLKAAGDELDARITTAMKPGLIQAELMETARRAKLDVREIQPVQAGARPPGDPSRNYPCYRVSVRGTYRQIAEYLELCKAQRVPARVKALQVSRDGPVGDAKPADSLAATITVEVFQFHDDVAAQVKG